MKKFAFYAGRSLFLITCLFIGHLAMAQKSLHCQGPRTDLQAKVEFLEGTRTEYGVEEICNGGVGDPMICKDVSYVIEEKSVRLELSMKDQVLKVQFPIQRKLGSNMPEFSSFHGEVELRQKSRISITLHQNSYDDSKALYFVYVDIWDGPGTPGHPTAVLDCHK